MSENEFLKYNSNRITNYVNIPDIKYKYIKPHGANNMWSKKNVRNNLQTGGGGRKREKI